MRNCFITLLTLFVLKCNSQAFFKDLNPGAASSTPSRYVTLNSNMYFFATDPSDQNSELWVSDGTSGGTSQVKNINASGGAVDIYSPLLINGNYLYFIANDGFSGTQLWRSDGTASGTIRLTSSQGFQPVQDITVSNGWVYFSSFDLTNGRELWRTDGSLVGTVLYADAHIGTASGIPDNNTGYNSMVDLNGTLYFVATNGVSGYEIFKTTTGGAGLVKDHYPGNNTNDKPEHLFAFNNKVYYSFTNGSTGYEPHSTDGTVSGTGLLSDVNAGSNGSGPTDFTISQGKMIFTAFTNAEGRELWITDGTGIGTTLLKAINPGVTNMSSIGSDLIAAGTYVYFNADNGGIAAMWRTDGTQLGTIKIQDGLLISSNYPYFFGNKVYFSATPDTSTNGNAYVYVSDIQGTSSILLNHNCGSYSYNHPGIFGSFNNKIYFCAEETASNLGYEMWTIDPSAIGMEEINMEYLRIFPNPVKDYLNITSINMKDAVVRITNMMGQASFEGNVQDGKIYLHDLPKGLYYLEIKNDSNIRITKLIKE